MAALTLPCGCIFTSREMSTPVGKVNTWYVIRTPCERHKDLYMKQQREPNPLDCICTEDDCRGQECDFCWRSDPRVPCPAMEE